MRNSIWKWEGMRVVLQTGIKRRGIFVLCMFGISIWSCGQNKRECGGPYNFQIIHSAIL